MAKLELRTPVDLYTYLEGFWGDPEDGYFTPNFFTYIDRCNAAGDTQEAQLAHWEWLIVSNAFVDGDDEPASVNEQEITDDCLNYIETRLTEAKSPFLVAIYAHWLWIGRRKHRKFAERAVDAYLSMVPILEQLDSVFPKSLLGFKVVNALVHAGNLATQIHFREEDFRTEVLRLIQNFDFCSPSSFAIRGGLAQLMLEKRRGFSKDDRQLALRVVDEQAVRLGTGDAEHAAIEMLGLAAQLAKACQLDTRSFFGRIGEAYERVMESQGAGREWEAQHFCLLAVDAYRDAGEDAEVVRLEKKLPELVRSAKLACIEPSPEMLEALQQREDRIRAAAVRVAGSPTKDILTFIMMSTDLLPSKLAVESAAEQQINGTFFGSISVNVSDTSGNLAENAVTEEERLRFQALQVFQQGLSTTALPFVHACILEGLKNGNLGAEAVVAFLRSETWFGSPRKRTVASQDLDYTWIDLLAPSISSYLSIFVQWQQTNKYPFELAILATASMTLKIEGLLRELCELFGGSRGYVSRDKQDRPISREKDLDRLLREPILVQEIGADTLFFLRFLLTEKAGFNLRHRVAHSLMITPEYAFHNLHLLFVAIMRLATFSFEPLSDPGCDEQT